MSHACCPAAYLAAMLLGLPAPAQVPAAPAPQVPSPAQNGFAQAAAYSTKLGGHAVLIMLDGTVVFEQYDNGWRAERPHPLASGTKSFAGSVAAAAVEDGLITWDELVSDTITSWKADANKSAITVRHLLNLSSGLAPSESTLQGGFGMLRPAGRAEPDRSQLAEDRFAAALEVPTNHAPGTKFEYGPSHYYAFGAFLEAKLAARKASNPTFPDSTYTQYMTRRVLEPVGLRFGPRGAAGDDAASGFWGKDKAGHLNLPGGAGLTAREWARYGEFIRLQGSVTQPDGSRKQVIAWEHLEECFKPSKANRGYGLTWWLPTGAMSQDDSTQSTSKGDATSDAPGGTIRQRLRQRLRDAALEQELQNSRQLSDQGADGKPLTVYMAAGLGKQRLYVLPELGVTVVRFSTNTAAGRSFSNLDFLTPILNHVRTLKTPAVPAR